MVKLLEKYRDSTREVCQAAEDALEQLISAVNPNRCVDTLIPLISSEGGAVLQVCDLIQYVLFADWEAGEHTNVIQARADAAANGPVRACATNVPGTFRRFQEPMCRCKLCWMFCVTFWARLMQLLCLGKESRCILLGRHLHGFG
jgi:hypothetical protein